MESKSIIDEVDALKGEKRLVALKVIEAATKYGINPEFVLPLVMIESGFDPKAKSPAGAVGPMQLTPIAAKDLKIDDPTDVDQNIDGGMRLLRRLIDNKKLEGDPEKILAAYNAGPSHKFFETGDPNDLPRETIFHVDKVFQYFGNDAPSMAITDAPSEKVEPQQAEPDQVGPGDEDWRQNITYDRLQDLSLPEQAAIMGPVGHAKGAVLGSAKSFILDPLLSRVEQVFGAPESAKPIPETPAPTSSEWKPAEPLKKPEQVAEEALTRSQQQRLSPADKSVTGREAQTGYAEATGQQAARRKFQEQIAKQLGLDVNRPMAEFPEVASTRSGIVAPQQTIDAMEAERLAEMERLKARAQLAQSRAELAQRVGGDFQKLVQRGQTFKPPAPPPEPSPSIMSRYLSSFPGKMGSFGFGAAAMAPYAVEAYRRARDKFGDQSNIPGLAAVTVPTAGGLASLKFPRLFGGATMGLGLGYALTHPKEVAESLSYSDINPTAFMGMPEETRAPFPGRGGLP